MTELSIIILAYNNWAFTKNCLNHLLSLNNNCEIIVVNNGSTDQTKNELDLLVEKYSNLKAIHRDKNYGFANSANYGFKNAGGKLVMFLNNDIRYGSNTSEWVYKIIDIVNENKGKLFSPSGGFINTNKNFEFEYETSTPDKKFNYLSGWMLIGEKEIFEKLIIPGQSGPFDENFFFYYEDTDLGFRAKELNIELSLVPVPIMHLGKQTSKKMGINKLYLDSRKKFLSKWKDRIKNDIYK